MIEEHLEAIRAKEKEAKARIRGAEAQAQDIIEKARQEGENQIEQVKIDAAQLERSLKAEAADKATAEIEELRAENSRTIKSLNNIADRNQDEALDLIVKAFRGGL